MRLSCPVKDIFVSKKFETSVESQEPFVQGERSMKYEVKHLKEVAVLFKTSLPTNFEKHQTNRSKRLYWQCAY